MPAVSILHPTCGRHTPQLPPPTSPSALPSLPPQLRLPQSTSSRFSENTHIRPFRILVTYQQLCPLSPSRLNGSASRSLTPIKMIQSPMISCPLKQTNEIDWIRPLKDFIRQSYGEDPERYSQECATLNRLRQDMRGAGKDSATGRDLLYRYYGQLELLDLRFPVDENHIKISFTWYG